MNPPLPSRHSHRRGTSWGSSAAMMLKNRKHHRRTPSNASTVSATTVSSSLHPHSHQQQQQPHAHQHSFHRPTIHPDDGHATLEDLRQLRLHAWMTTTAPVVEPQQRPERAVPPEPTGPVDVDDYYIPHVGTGDDDDDDDTLSPPSPQQQQQQKTQAPLLRPHHERCASQPLPPRPTVPTPVPKVWDGNADVDALSFLEGMFEDQPPVMSRSQRQSSSCSIVRRTPYGSYIFEC